MKRDKFNEITIMIILFFALANVLVIIHLLRGSAK